MVASDGPGEYAVLGDVLAGNSGDIKVKPGSCAYITTGNLRFTTSRSARIGCWF